MNEQTTPLLAPPGAGLPKIELFFARLLIGFKRMRGTREAFTAEFVRERDAILALVRPLPPETAAKRVLIKRLPGIEDSSRYWSVWMTLDHLRIVNDAFTGTIKTLVEEKTPDRVASTAAVKPDPNAGAAVVGEFERSCEAFLKISKTAPDLRTKARFKHPWFGPLDAASWHALGGLHLNLHRRQIERILAGL